MVRLFQRYRTTAKNYVLHPVIHCWGEKDLPPFDLTQLGNKDQVLTLQDWHEVGFVFMGDWDYIWIIKIKMEHTMVGKDKSKLDVHINGSLVYASEISNIESTPLVQGPYKIQVCEDYNFILNGELRNIVFVSYD